MSNSLDDSLIEAADASLSRQRDDGSFPPGHNGPYHDPETPVRNTAHYLYLYAALYEKTKNGAYRYAVLKSLYYA